MTRVVALFLCLCAMLALAVGLPTSAWSQERVRAVGYEDFSELAAKVHQLEAENAQIRAQLQSGMMAPYDGLGGPGGCGGDCGGRPCDHCCDSCCCEPSCCPCGHWYAGAELTFMEPRWNDWNALSVITQPAGNFFLSTVAHDWDYDPTARFYLGYTGCNGLGVRSSWWEFDHDSQLVAAVVPVGGQVSGFSLGSTVPGERIDSQQSLEVTTIDLEITNSYEACGGQCVVGFGLRYARFEVTTRERNFDVAGVLTDDASITTSFEGVGPTVCLEFTRPLCFPGWELYSNLRTSVIFGDDHTSDLTRQNVNTAAPRFVGHSQADNEGVAIEELQIGLQWACGCWTVRGAWQAQYWNDVARSDRPFDPEIATLHDLFLQGFSISVGGQF